MVGFEVSTYKLSQPQAMNSTTIKFISSVLAICQIVFLDSLEVNKIKQITD
jgi:hypothetical protein